MPVMRRKARRCNLGQHEWIRGAVREVADKGLVRRNRRTRLQSNQCGRASKKSLHH
jgi:hypothetical protein